MSTSLRNILLATDDSRGAEVALRAAANISEKSGAALHVVHVWTDGLLEEQADKTLRQQAWKARAAGARALWVYLREGEPVEEIVALAEDLDADLVVVGSRGAGWMKRLVTGSVSEGVVHRASCPVLVVGGGQAAWPVNRVVVGDDGSWSAQSAGELAAELADLFGAEVVLVRAYENPPAPVGGWSAEDRRELDDARLRDLRALEERAERLETMARGRPETRLAESKATPAIASVAEGGERGAYALRGWQPRSGRTKAGAVRQRLDQSPQGGGWAGPRCAIRRGSGDPRIHPSSTGTKSEAHKEDG